MSVTVPFLRPAPSHHAISNILFIYYAYIILLSYFIILYYIMLCFITDYIHNGSLCTSQIVNVHGTLVKFALEAEAGVFATSQVPLRTSDFG